MWLQTSGNKTSSSSSLLNDLFQECRYSAPGAQLTCQLRHRIERLPAEERKAMVSQLRDGCSPLFMACKRGHVEKVEYLISTCGADVEQKGLYEVPDDRSTHCVTPLWCAAVSGKLAVIKCLVSHGANVNALSDSGSTPVRSACFMTHLDIVQFLVENGADIQRGNYNGGTCLINSVQSVELCLYLLQKGADVNAKDVQNKSALHYAIQEHRLETAKLLLDNGADPYACSRYGDDALQTACLKGALHIFRHLVVNVPYTKERLADAHDLIGSTFLDEYNETQSALRHWETAIAIRQSSDPPLKKLPEMAPQPAYGSVSEVATQMELRAMSLDVDALRTQSLLICERILGPSHKDTLFRVMYRGAAYADSLLYQRCIDLWLRALELRIAKDSIFNTDTCFTAYSLVRMFVDLTESNAEWKGQEPRFEDVLATYKLVANELPVAKKLLEIHPIHRKQAEIYDRMLRCVTHLIHLLLVTATSEDDRDLIRDLVRDLVHSRPRSALFGDTLLHLCSSRLNTCMRSYTCSGVQPPIFPSFPVVKLLLEVGAPVNVRNQALCTPLHIAANSYNFNQKVCTGIKNLVQDSEMSIRMCLLELVELLLDHGGHLDQPNANGDSPKLILAHTPLPLGKYETLRCLAATAVVKYKLPYRSVVPHALADFVQLHEPRV